MQIKICVITTWLPPCHLAEFSSNRCRTPFLKLPSFSVQSSQVQHRGFLLYFDLHFLVQFLKWKIKYFVLFLDFNYFLCVCCVCFNTVARSRRRHQPSSIATSSRTSPISTSRRISPTSTSSKSSSTPTSSKSRIWSGCARGIKGARDSINFRQKSLQFPSRSVSLNWWL